MTKPHNPPAFPASEEVKADNGHWRMSQPGMTLRDYFAAAALQGLLARYGNQGYESAANYAYGFADSMLKAREVENE